MKLKKYFRILGTTSACVKRMLDAALRFKTKEPGGSQNSREENDKEEINLWDYDNIDEYCDAV